MSEFKQPQSLKRSSKAFFALFEPLGEAWLCVSRSMVVRGSKSSQVLRASLGLTRALIVCVHSKRLPGSKCRHWAHACRSDPHFEHCPVSEQACATVNSFPHRAQRTTWRNPGMFGARGSRTRPRGSPECCCGFGADGPP